MTFRVPTGYNPADLPGQIVDDGSLGRIVDPITGASLFNPNSDPNETGIDPLTDEPFVAGTDQGFGLTVFDALNAGVYNGSFGAGPREGVDSQVEEIYNEIPYWRYVQDDSGHIRSSWVADAEAPGGYAVRFTATDAVSGDTAYYEQIIPVSPAERVRVPIIVLGPASATSATLATYLELDPLDIDGVAIGTTATDSTTWGTSTTTVDSPVGLPASARYLRLRFGVTASGSHTGPDTIDVREAWAGRPHTIDITMFGGDTTLPTTGSQVSDLIGGQASGAKRIVPPGVGVGWVSYIGARLQGAITGGSISVSVYDENNDVTVGPAAPIALTNWSGWATGVWDATTNAIAANARLRFISTVTSGLVTSLGHDLYAVAVLTYVLPRDSSASRVDTD